MRIVRYVSLALFLTHLIQNDRGIFRLFEQMRYDMPRFVESSGYDKLAITLSAILRPDWQRVIVEYGLDEELAALTRCPFCLTAYTSMVVMIMPLPIRRWLEVWMIGYTMLWLEQEGYLKRLQFDRYIPFSGKVPTRGE